MVGKKKKKIVLVATSDMHPLPNGRVARANSACILCRIAVVECSNNGGYFLLPAIFVRINVARWIQRVNRLKKGRRCEVFSLHETRKNTIHS